MFHVSWVWIPKRLHGTGFEGGRIHNTGRVLVISKVSGSMTLLSGIDELGGALLLLVEGIA